MPTMGLNESRGYFGLDDDGDGDDDDDDDDDDVIFPSKPPSTRTSSMNDVCQKKRGFTS